MENTINHSQINSADGIMGHPTSICTDGACGLLMKCAWGKLVTPASWKCEGQASGWHQGAWAFSCEDSFPLESTTWSVL